MAGSLTPGCSTDVAALRYNDWKLSFKTIKGNLFTASEESTNVPLVTKLRQDPWERYQDQSMMRKHRGCISADVQGVSAEPGGWILEHREGTSDGPERSQRRRQMSCICK
jgi:hypothetical protein